MFSNRNFRCISGWKQKVVTNNTTMFRTKCSRQRSCMVRSNMLYLCLHTCFLDPLATALTWSCHDLKETRLHLLTNEPKHPKSLLPQRCFHMIPRLPRVAPDFLAWVNSGNMMQQTGDTDTIRGMRGTLTFAYFSSTGANCRPSPNEFGHLASVWSLFWVFFWAH